MMRRLKRYSLDERGERPILSYRDSHGMHKIEILAGRHQHVEMEILREGKYTYALTWNTNFPYVGLERFVGSERHEALFLHELVTIASALGNRWSDLTSIAMAKKMLNYLNELDRRERT